MECHDPAIERAAISQWLGWWIRAVARTKEQRLANGDSRLSIAERYSSRQEYLDKVKRAADDLVGQRFLRPEDVPAVMQSAERMWNAIAIP